MYQPDLLLEFLDVFRQLAGASQASLALHLEPLERRSLFLANAGDEPALPELVDEDAAWHFVSSHLSAESDHHPVTEIASAESGGVLLRVSFRRLLPQPVSRRRDSDERRQDPVVRTAPPCDGALWVGLRNATQADRLVAELNQDIEDGASTDSALEMLTGVCFRMAWSVYYLSSLTLDTVSRLPGRTHLQVFLRRAISAMRSSSQPISLMLINPDDFAMINCRHGRGRGDQAIREIAGSLELSLRSTDGLFRYSGAVFAAVLPATDLDQCRVTADKVRKQLSKKGYLDDNVPLTFSVGAAVALPGDLESFEDLERMLCDGADAALNSARLSGGAQSRVTGLNLEEHERATMNPLTGIFAADTEKDYRNMLLLWDTVALVSTQNEPSAIAAAFVDRLATAFRPDRLALVQRSDEGLDTLASSVRDETAADNRIAGRPLRLSGRCQKLISDAIDTGQVTRSTGEGAAAGSASAYAVPLVASNVNRGCLFMDGRADTLKIDSSDVVFLNALASQMAVAIDRAELASRQIEEKDRESRSLRQEVQGLRKALNHSKLVYQSDAMHKILQLLGRVAPTDATVLIIGESGTGKEVLAQSVHELSNRRDAPFVVFDCGAVAASLLEAELFGHTKGAYTGADRASEGHIARAEGGTLFLDEIGELPLAIQAKLLRFVQEKEYSPVGSAKTRTVDVRIVAATNRELDKEVAAGRFRADLYYRLRVIAVDAPPLRERPDDVLPLAHFFMEKFAAQNGKPVHRLSTDAEQKLRQHRWPGNVRELQNTILRAVLTHASGTLDASCIDLQADGLAAIAQLQPARPAAQPDPMPEPSLHHNGNGAAPVAAAASQPEVRAAHEHGGDPWQSLQTELERQVELAVASNDRRPAPLGRWLSEDLILHANEVCGSVARQAAQLVQVPESTFRRQLEKASADAANGSQFRSDSWASIRPLLEQVVENVNGNGGAQGNLLDRSRHTLMRCVRSKVGGRTAAAASLMGVTPMTYKRWLADQENRP